MQFKLKAFAFAAAAVLFAGSAGIAGTLERTKPTTESTPIPNNQFREVPQLRLELCGQTTMKGEAPPATYDSETACVNDRPNQQDIAENNGKSKCDSYCTSLGKDCTAQPPPKPPKSTPACKEGDDKKWHTQVSTGPFDCICKK